MRLSCASLLVAFALAGAPLAADDLQLLEEKIDSLHLTQARRAMDDLDKEHRESPRGKYLAGRLLFFEGEYEESLDQLRSAIEGARTEVRWKELRDTVTVAREHVEPLTEVEGASGKFVFRHAEGLDSLLVPYADRALAAQLEVLSGALEDKPEFKIQVLLLPDAEHMAAVSGLTVEQIERTGTVGVSKYGKVMILSPRALATGYPWLETLAHELNHLFIARASMDRAPIWLQEGLAKLLEARWRSDGPAELTPQEAYLLDRAARERRLIPLRRFHPSVALLPNQEDAALAYAQVLSFIRYVDERAEDPDWIRVLLSRIGEGAGVDEAFVEASKYDVQRLYNWWRQIVSGKRLTPVPAVGLMKRRYQTGATSDRGGTEAILETDVRKLIRLGDLLRLRGHISSAATEYRRALALADTHSPEITDRLGGCLLEQQKYDEVVVALRPVSHLYPSHSTIFVQLGTALAKLGQNDEAARSLEQAEAVNPFQPEIHCTLTTVYRALGDDEKADLEKRHCRSLATPRRENAARPSAGN